MIMSKIYEEVYRSYRSCAATIVLHKESNMIPIKNGVRQRDTVSLVLFTACLEAFRDLEWEQLGIKVDAEYLSNLRFANDIALLS